MVTSDLLSHHSRHSLSLSLQMVRCLTEDSCDNPWIHEILEFSTPRVRKLFGDGWDRERVVKLVVFTIMSGVALASARGVVLGKFVDTSTIRIEVILGERGIIFDAIQVWKDLYPQYSVIAKRHGKLKNMTYLYGRTRH